jgi:hypothetical protein
MVSVARIATLVVGGLVALVVLGYNVVFLQQLLLGLVLSVVAFVATVAAGTVISRT